MSTSETPRTEAELTRITKEGGFGDDFEMLADHSRQLERELAQLREEREGLRAALERVQKATIARNSTLEEWMHVQSIHHPKHSRYVQAREEHDAAWNEYTQAWNEAAKLLHPGKNHNQEEQA